jgi:hypothetical protein
MIGTENFNPRLNPQKLVHGYIHPHSRQKFAMRCPSFVAVFLRVESQDCLDFRVTQEPLDGLRFDLRLVHKPIAQTVSQVVKSESLPVCDFHVGFLAVGRR